MAKSILALSVLAVVLTGCQQYRPSPLDLGSHAVRWAGRDATAPELAQYAARLGTLGHAMPEAFDVADGLSLCEAEAVALFFNPRLRVARLRAKVPLLGAQEAGRWVDPELEIDGERIVESVKDPWVLAGTISFTIPLSGRLAVERARAFAEADAERLRAYVEEAAVLADLRRAWVEWTVGRQRRELAAQYLKELEEVLRTAEGLLRAREIDATDVRPFQIERATRRAELQSLELEQREREARVKALLGLVPEARVELLPSFPDVSRPASAPDRRRWVQEYHPAVLLARAEYAASEKALELEVRRQYPDLTLGGGYGTEEGQSRILLGAGLPLPLLNRNRRAIAEAQASRDVAKAAAEGGFEDLVGQLFRAELAAEAARRRRQLIETDVIPLADQQINDLRRLGRLGEFNTLILLEALQTAYEAKVLLLETRAIEAAATNELNALSGVGVLPRPGAKDGQ
jgi:outer membrane protein TolC